MSKKYKCFSMKLYCSNVVYQLICNNNIRIAFEKKKVHDNINAK